MVMLHFGSNLLIDFMDLRKYDLVNAILNNCLQNSLYLLYYQLGRDRFSKACIRLIKIVKNVNCCYGRSYLVLKINLVLTDKNKEVRFDYKP